jgi:hypothetical protein
MQTRCPWDISFDASFIYWQPIQENMEFAVINKTATAAVADQFSALDGRVVNQEFDYKPGFKVGMGGYFDHDGWDLHGEYTWFHTHQSHSDSIGTGEQAFPLWGLPLASEVTFDPSASVVDNVYQTAHEKWHLLMDIADLDLGRWYYVGTKLTFRPNFGVRAAWIRQKVDVKYDNSLGNLTPTIGIVDHAEIKQSSSSWAVGAKTGLDTNWIIGSGFRLYGCGEADLLFTKYTKARFKETHTGHSGEQLLDYVKVSQKKIYAVRPHLDLELGFGWGTYLDCNNWYMDFSAGYGFQVFFDQNMFRHFSDDIIVFGSNSPNGNLYVQGLTATFKLDF